MSNTSSSREMLDAYYEEMRVEVEPVYGAFGLECGDPCVSSPWAIVGQDIIADINDTAISLEVLHWKY